jgi:hypothetical protein
MPHRKPPAFLRIVEQPAPQARVRAEDFSPSTWQATLFAQSNPSLLVFVDFERVTESDFLTVLVAARPRFMIDLRLAPHFEIGAANRKLVFSLFAQHATKYIDLAGRLAIKDHKDARLNPRILSGIVVEMMVQKGRPIVGPVGFLVDHAHFDDSYVRALTEAMSPSFSIACEILKVPYQTLPASPAASGSTQSRRLVFISHANPEDNDFTRWLGVKLASAGYEVWSDVTNLLGGEEIWDSIEDAIRRHAAKVVVVLSHKSQTKLGMLDEINCAVSVERSNELDGFVMPVRIDDLPFAEVRANLARKNIIDFKENWAGGLAQLLKSLERDGVPRSASTGSDRVAAFYRERANAPTQLAKTPEKLVSNWLRIASLPETVQLYSSNASLSHLGPLAKQIKVPNFRYLRLIGTFAESADILGDLPPEIGLQLQFRIETGRFLVGGTHELPGMQWREAQNIVSSLIRQAWNSFAAGRGLRQYQVSSGAVAWFVPKALVDSDRVSFTDGFGKLRRKQLLGWSERRKVHWHYAVELRPSLGKFPHMTLRSHVVFTEDGLTPLESKERMHALRRRFCKNWWNDRWRDLSVAYLRWLAGDAAMTISCGGSSVVMIEAAPRIFESPVSMPHEEPEPTSEESGDLADLDDDDWSADGWFEPEPVGEAPEDPSPAT